MLQSFESPAPATDRDGVRRTPRPPQRIPATVLWSWTGHTVAGSQIPRMFAEIGQQTILPQYRQMMVEENNQVDDTVGICLSGGGIRAASFAMGALQALDARLNLLRGQNCAEYLSAVSGGSYIAGAFTLINSGTQIRTTDGEPIDEVADLPPNTGPFEPGSPEADHMGRHCSYLIEDGGLRNSLRMIGLILTGIVMTLLLIAAVGATAVYLEDLVGLGMSLLNFELPPQFYAWPAWTLLVGFFAALLAAGALIRVWRVSATSAPYRQERGLAISAPRRWAARCVVWFLLPLGVFGCVVVAGMCASYAIGSLKATAVAALGWCSKNPEVLAVGVLAVAGLLGMLMLLKRRRLAVALVLLGVSYGLRFVVLVIVLGVAIIVDGFISENLHHAIWYLVSLAVGLAIIVPWLGRVSPHRPYRDMLSRCFVITRGDPIHVPEQPEKVAFSSLRPPPRGRPDSFPELSICAAANVSDVGASPAGTNVVPLSITADEVYVSGVPGAAISMKRLEEQTRRAGLSGRKREPLMSLPAAVAIAGAAVAPAMGRMTNNRLRQLMVVLNVRLGVWLPNPLNRQVRESEGRFQLFSAVNSFLLEFFGSHSSKFRTVFATDGGHYENLGLVELVRRGCTTIWCVDSSGGPPGASGALAQSLLLAETVTGARIELDIDRFKAVPDSASTRPRVQEVFAIGRIHYPKRSPGRIIVIKLGLSERSTSALREYQKTYRAFPHHSTLNQTYRAERFIAYRRLGWDSTLEAITAWAEERVDSNGQASLFSAAARDPRAHAATS